VTKKIYSALELLECMGRVVKNYPPPLSVQLIDEYGRDPFLILISCLLSLRARDTMTYPVFKKLWERAKTPQELVALSREELEALVRPLGFFRQKARVLHAVSIALLQDHEGLVPQGEAELLSLPGVGRKTMALVRAEAFFKAELCVDTHVHRIANHLGLVETKTVEETERALKNIFPRERWAEVNRVFVVWGQQVCRVGRKRCVCFEALT